MSTKYIDTSSKHLRNLCCKLNKQCNCFCAVLYESEVVASPFVLAEHAVIRTQSVDTVFMLRNPIAAACFGCTKQPSSGRMYQKVQKETYTTVAVHIIIPRSYNYMHDYSCGRPDGGCFFAVETCSCLLICFNKSRVSTDCFLIIWCLF
jgi:hypothetical protein